MKKLTELSPQWIDEAGVKMGILFTCPHCMTQRLFVPFTKMKVSEQYALLAFNGIPEDQLHHIAVGNPNQAWQQNGKGFSELSLTPSVDASPSGCWHGFITDGEIR